MERDYIFDMVIPVGGSMSVNDSISVEDTTTIFDTDSDLKPRSVPGSKSEKYIPWGDDDKLPFQLIKLISEDEVTSQNKLFNVLTCYGAGVALHDDETDKPTTDAQVIRWSRRQSLPAFFLNQATDMKYYYFAVAVLILSRDGKMVNRVVHKDACYCRLAEADDKGRIPYVYYANWSKSGLERKDVEKIPLLDLYDPFGDLMERMGRQPDPTGRKVKEQGERKFAMLMRFPTAGCRYYPFPYWASIFSGGSYDDMKVIGEAKRAKHKNSSSLKYQVEVARGYYERICTEEGITDPEQMKERIKEEKKNIEDYVLGRQNAGKTLITQYYIDPYGHESRDVRITLIDTKKEGGDWSEDEEGIINKICFADNIYPDLPGAVPGKTQSNHSGSDKREMFVIKQALEIAYHDILLMPLNVACWYNEWNVHPTIPMIQLTTLDEHKDAKRVNPKVDSHADND